MIIGCDKDDDINPLVGTWIFIETDYLASTSEGCDSFSCQEFEEFEEYGTSCVQSGDPCGQDMDYGLISEDACGEIDGGVWYGVAASGTDDVCGDGNLDGTCLYGCEEECAIIAAELLGPTEDTIFAWDNNQCIATLTASEQGSAQTIIAAYNGTVTIQNISDGETETHTGTWSVDGLQLTFSYDDYTITGDYSISGNILEFIDTETFEPIITATYIYTKQ